MKQIILPLFLLLLSHFAFSQRDPNVGKYFEFTENVKLKYCDGVGAPVAGEDIINSGIQFKIDGTDDKNDYIIHVLYDNKDNVFNNRFYNANYSALRTGNKNARIVPSIYFTLPKGIFEKKSKERLHRNSLTIGIVNLPLKMRFGSKEPVEGKYQRNFLVTSDVSLGFSVGYKHKWSDSWGINILTGLAYSAIDVDSSTTKGFAKSAANPFAVTGHLGVLMEVDNFQFGLFSGIDYMTGAVGKQWIYRNKPWLGIAIGYSLFKTKSTSDSQ